MLCDVDGKLYTVINVDSHQTHIYPVFIGKQVPVLYVCDVFSCAVDLSRPYVNINL